MKTAMPLSLSANAGLTPSCMIHRLRWPPPGAMTIATPVAMSLRGRNAMIDGLWTLRTVSPSICSGSPLRASDPGAPFGHRTMVGWPGGMTTAGGFGAAGAAAAAGAVAGGVWAAAAHGHANAAATTNEADFVGLTSELQGNRGPWPGIIASRVR